MNDTDSSFCGEQVHSDSSISRLNFADVFRTPIKDLNYDVINDGPAFVEIRADEPPFVDLQDLDFTGKISCEPSTSQSNSLDLLIKNNKLRTDVQTGDLHKFPHPDDYIIVLEDQPLLSGGRARNLTKFPQHLIDRLPVVYERNSDTIEHQPQVRQPARRR